MLSRNDILVNDTPDHSDVFDALDIDFELSPTIQSLLPAVSKSRTKILPVIENVNAAYMFDGLSYTKPRLFSLLDSLYVGKVKAWDDNGLQVDSCEEYVFV